MWHWQCFCCGGVLAVKKQVEGLSLPYMYTWQKLQCAANQRYALYHHLHLPFLHFYRDFATFTSSEYYEHFLAGISTSCLYYSCVYIIKDKSRCTAKTSAPKLVIVPVGVVYRKYSIFFLVAGTLHCTRLCFALLLQTVSTHTLYDSLKLNLLAKGTKGCV